MKKKSLLIVGITMNSAGTEKSFLSFASKLNYDEWDVTLLLAKKEGLFLSLVPDRIRVVEMEEYGDLFLLSGRNAARCIWRTMAKKKPRILLTVLPYFLKILFRPSARSSTAAALWCRLMREMPPFPGHYDVAAAYWGDRTMFYLCEKVEADRKLAWLHFDYGNPPRDDALYLPYFRQCDAIVTVSDTVHRALCDKLPEIADRCVMMENINDPALIRDLALRGETFPDPHYQGLRILTVGRISYQKGYDMVPPVIRRLADEGYEFRWYVLGGGEEAEVEKLKVQALDCGVANRMIFLGTTSNPYSYLRDCDLYVQPSRYEGKPITVEEAKMLYKPIVATDYLSASEQLGGGRFGVITPISEEGLYEGVKALLCDPERRDALTETLARENFGNVGEMEKFYRMAEGTLPKS